MHTHTDSFLFCQVMLVVPNQCCSEGFCWDGMWQAAKKAESAKSKLLIVFQSPDGTMAKLMEGLER